MPDAFKVSVRKDAIALFEKHGIFNEAELHARYEINMENLVKKIQIESRVLADLAANHIVPTAIRYQNILIQNVKGLKDILPDEYADMAAEEIRTIRKIARYVKAIRENTYHMVDARKKPWTTSSPWPPVTPRRCSPIWTRYATISTSWN